MELNELKDNELSDKLSNAEFIERFIESDGWKLIDEACKRVVKKAQAELSNVNAGDMVKIIELQQIIKLYKNVLNGLINSFKAEGLMAFEEAKERGLIKSAH